MHFKTRFVFWVLGFSLLSLGGAQASDLQGVNFASLPGDRTEISLNFSDAPPVPDSYTIERPARIALDLVGVNNRLAEKYHNLGLGNAKRMTVIGAKGRTRIILDLVELVPYDTRVVGNTLVIVVGSGGADSQFVSVQEGSSTNSAAEMQSQKNSVTSIDFHRGEKGDGQIVINFASPNVDIDMTEIGGNIQLRMPAIDLPLALQQRLDVVDFATPV